MDATQQIEDSLFGEQEEEDSDQEQDLEEGKGQRQPLALLKVFKNNHIPETEVPLYQGENVLGRDPACCSVLLQARSISGCHAVISISTFGTNDRRGHSESTEALLWDLGSLNGTRKGRLKLTPNVRYALSEGDGVVLADLPCQYVILSSTERSTPTSAADGGREKAKGATVSSVGQKGAENGLKKNVLPPVPAWPDDEKSPTRTTPKKPETTLVPESDSDSDGEKHGRRDRRRIVASDSASSDLSSPTCSTFLTPANKVIPESEDESSVTPSPALQGKFPKTENDHEVSAASLKAAPLLFNIDSDTDVEDEGVETTRSEDPSGAAAINPVDLHMDSDTDVDEEEIEKTKPDPEASKAPVKQDSVNPGTPNVDSDTDVEEDESVRTDTTEKKESAISGLFHLESDTDEEDVPHIQAPQPKASHIAEFNMNSDTDVEEEEDEGTGNATEPPSDITMDSKDCIKHPDARVFGHQSDSDTDVEDDVTEIRTPAEAKKTGNSQSVSERSADARHDSPVQAQGPSETLQNKFRLDSDVDDEEKGQKCIEEAAVQIVHSSTPRGAGLSGEERETGALLSPTQLFKRPGLPSLPQPSISPGALAHTDDDFAVAETQPFVCDANATLEETPPSPGDAESPRTGGASSFPLGQSDSSHQLPETREHDREPAEDEWQLQETQLYVMKNSEATSKAEQTQMELDATQAYTDVMDMDSAEGKEEETQPPGALGHSAVLPSEKGASGASEHVVASEPERVTEEDEELDSHLSTADTLLIVRSPKQGEQPQATVSLATQIQKEQEERAIEEHGTGDEEKKEREQTQNESVGQENNEGSMMKETNEVTREEEEKKEQVEKEERAQPTRTVAETLPMCEEEEGADEEQLAEPNSNRGIQFDKFDLARVAVAETLPMCEEEEGEELIEPGSSRPVHPATVESTQPLELVDLPRVAVAETLPMCEEEEEADEEQLAEPNSNKGIQSDKFDLPHVVVAETLPMCEVEEEADEEQPAEPSFSKHTQPAVVEPTQRLEPDSATAGPLPVCEEEEQDKPRNSRRPGRRRQPASVVPKSSVKSDLEDKKAQESFSTSTRRSSMRRNGAKAKSLESRVAVPETLPMNEEVEAQEEKPQSETKSGRKSRRGKPTSKPESTQPLKPETAKMDDEEDEQDTTRSLRGKGKGRGKGKHVGKKGKRGNGEQDSASEVEEDGGNKGRRGKDLRQKSTGEAGIKESEGIEHSRTEKEAGEREKREESTRLEKEREEREAREKQEQEEMVRLEKERIERETEEREAQEMEARAEKERVEREQQLEKERTEQEQQQRQDREKMEREKKEREEKEKLEKEKRERKELEEQLERERRKREEEEERIAREQREREAEERKEEKEQQEKEMEQREKETERKGNKKGVDKGARQAPGKRKTGLGRKGKKSTNEEEEEGNEKRLENDQDFGEKQKQDGNDRKDEQAEGDAIPRRGRRTTRKSPAPPVDAGDEGGPAQRTRSRSNSSNSVCSEQSPQDSLSDGRRSGGRRKIVEEANEKSRASDRRTSTAPSRETENTKRAARSRSDSRSSDRSSVTGGTPSQGVVGKRRKMMTAEELEEKEELGKQPAAVGRGRGRGRARGGKCTTDIKTEAEKPEVEAVSEHTTTSQSSSSRGRKRGADVSLLMPGTPQPTPKTPRRSVTGPTHKVLFTGVTDEDGEKVVARLGGGLAKGVDDMTHLVTDKVRRTVKFLCAVARGVPIVTPDWLTKCGKAGSFLLPNGFLVKDVEQEKRFNFSLQDSLRAASSQPLLQGYEIHVTPSVKPEPAHMKEIITCCGARFLPKMPSAPKTQTVVVVVSCEEDQALCDRARSLSFPVVSAEFLLTGILQQNADVQAHSLSVLPAAAQPKPAARRRGK